MIHFSVAELDRFAALGTDSQKELSRLERLIDRGALNPEHTFVATEAGRDVGRISLITLPDGLVKAYMWTSVIGGVDSAPIHDALISGVMEAARSAGIAEVETTIVDRDEQFPDDLRAAMSRHNWEVDSERLMLEIPARSRPHAAQIADVSPHDDAVVEVMALAMAESLDDYDRSQVAKLGPSAAASQYRDMMAQGASDQTWLIHWGDDGPNGIAAVLNFPDELCLGYLGVDPRHRQHGIGRKLTEALINRAQERGISVATASVAVGNKPIRATLEGVGFNVVSRRTDFLVRVTE